MRILLILFFIFLLLIQGCVNAERPTNEIPMYGGERQSFTKIMPPKNSKEIDEYRFKSQEAAQLGWQYFFQGNLETAIKRFNQAWLFDPDNPDVWWGFGVIQGARGKIENKESFYLDSVKYLEKASNLFKDNYRVMIDLSITYTNWGESKIETDPKQARLAFDSALRWSKIAEGINDKNALLWYNRAHTQSLMGLFKDAVINYKKAIEIEPEYIEAYNDFGWLLATCPHDKYRNGEKAVEFAKKAEKLLPNNPAINDTIAAAYAESGDFDSAVYFIKNAIALLKEEKNKDSLKEFEKRLDFYLQNKPWRDSKYAENW
jgi:tetratricopeptide (TPR) repeat protein